MHQILKRRPGKTTDHGGTSRGNGPWNRYPLETRIKAWQMIIAGTPYKEITARLGIGKSALSRIAKDGNPAKSLPAAAQRIQTACNGRESCGCVRCNANRQKTPERMRRIHAEDEAYRQEQLAKRRAELRGGV